MVGFIANIRTNFSSVTASMTIGQSQANNLALGDIARSRHLARMKMTATELSIRRADEHGQAAHGWLKSNHPFSLADYCDPAQEGFRSPRVINDDRVAPGRDCGTRPHRDMEIFSDVL